MFEETRSIMTDHKRYENGFYYCPAGSILHAEGSTLRLKCS